MALTRPSEALSQKTNVTPSVNRQQEATAEDFNEVGTLLNEYADAIELLTQNGSVNPYYGSYTSLAALQTAHSTALTDGWAIIDAGSGVTPQIAAWDDTTLAWEIAAATDLLVFVNSASSLPGAGDSQKLYITLDDNGLYCYNSDYIRLNPYPSAEVRIGNLWFYPPNSTNPLQITDGQEFRGFPTTDTYVAGIVLDATDFDPYNTSKAKLLIDN